MIVRYDNLTVGGTRKEIRKQVITKFLDEEPGSGTGENCSRYIYVVETINDSLRIVLKRPANLNKGMDFTVHVENLMFRKSGQGKDMPRHLDIINDLIIKKEANPYEHEKVRIILNMLYNCYDINQGEYENLKFNVGYPIEVILKAVKWLFIEQDVTYWNWSGRNMLFKALKDEGLIG